MLLYGYSVFILYLQTEKCFCAKGDKCPSIGEASERESQGPAKVCMVLVCLYICVVLMWCLAG